MVLGALGYACLDQDQSDLGRFMLPPEPYQSGRSWPSDQISSLLMGCHVLLDCAANIKHHEIRLDDVTGRSLANVRLAYSLTKLVVIEEKPVDVDLVFTCLHFCRPSTLAFMLGMLGCWQLDRECRLFRPAYTPEDVDVALLAHAAQQLSDLLYITDISDDPNPPEHTL